MDYYSLLLLTASRLKLIGPDIQFLIQRDNLPYNVEVRAEPGAMLADLERIGLDLLYKKQYHLVIVYGGVNDLTNLNKSKWIVNPIYDDLAHMVDTITNMLMTQ